MDEKRKLLKRRCVAMIHEGIYDPESKAGINFCVGFCPYDYCIVLEKKNPGGKQKDGVSVALVARRLKKHGVSVEDIALILDVTVRSVMRYLKL